MADKDFLRAPYFHMDINKIQDDLMDSEPNLPSNLKPHSQPLETAKSPNPHLSLLDFPRDGATTEVLNILDKPRDLLRKLLSLSFVMCGPSLVIEQNFEESKMLCGHQTPKSGFPTLQIDILRSNSPRYLLAVGWGSCGKIYKQLGTTYVNNKAINGNTALAEECRIWNDLIMHKKG